MERVQQSVGHLLRDALAGTHVLDLTVTLDHRLGQQAPDVGRLPAQPVLHGRGVDGAVVGPGQTDLVCAAGGERTAVRVEQRAHVLAGPQSGQPAQCRCRDLRGGGRVIGTVHRSQRGSRCL